MNKLRDITISGLLISIAVILQLIPAFMSEVFIIITMLSALPIFIISFTNPRLGVLSYLSASILVSVFSIHEGIMFIFTNGLIGTALGISGYYLKNKILEILISALFMSASLAVLNYGIGIPVFGSQIPGSILVQIIILFVFSLIYCILFRLFAQLIYKGLNKYLKSRP